MPSVRRILAENPQIDTARLRQSATGKSGRVLKTDIIRFLEQPASTSPAHATAAKATTTSAVGKSSESTSAAPGTKVSPKVKGTSQPIVGSDARSASRRIFEDIAVNPVTWRKNAVPHSYATGQLQISQLLGLLESTESSLVGATTFFASRLLASTSEFVSTNGHFDVAVICQVSGKTVRGVIQNAARKALPTVSDEALKLSASQGDFPAVLTVIQAGAATESLALAVNSPVTLTLGNSFQRFVVNSNGVPEAVEMVNVGLSFDERIMDSSHAAEFLAQLTDIMTHPSKALL